MSNIGFLERYRIPDYRDPKQISSGIVIIDTEKCNGCKICNTACPASALKMEKKIAQMVRKNECFFCGDCSAICPQDAITLKQAYKHTNLYKTIDQSEHCFPRL